MFAEAHDFLLYDLVRDDGSVDENVYAYSNGTGAGRSLIVYHNRFAETEGTLRQSVPFAVKGPDGSRSTTRRSLAEGLGIPADPDCWIGFRDKRRELEYLRPASQLHERGLRLHLDAYQCQVITGFRELRDAAGAAWSRLAADLVDRGVPSLEDALRDVELAPVHKSLRAVVDDPARLPDLVAAARAALGVAGAGATAEGPGDMRSAMERLGRRREAIRRSIENPRSTAVLEAWALLDSLVATFGRSVFADLRLGGPLDRALAARHELDAEAAHDVGWNGAVLVAASAAPLTARARLAAWITDPVVRTALGVHAWDGAEWLDGDAAEVLVTSVALGQTIDGAAARTVRARATQLRRTLAGSGYRVDALASPLRRPSRRG